MTIVRQPAPAPASRAQILARGGRTKAGEGRDGAKITEERAGRWVGPADLGVYRVEQSSLTVVPGCDFSLGSSGTFLPVKGRTFSMATVTYAKATRIYPGSTRPAVDALDLEIANGEFLVLVGPSGCGKSTSLRMLAGLEEIDSGAILIDQTDVTNVPPKSRDIAMVFQNYALYPHMTVYQNMAFALKLRKTPKDEIDRRVKEAARLLDMDEALLSRKPRGDQRTASLGRLNDQHAVT